MALTRLCTGHEYRRPTSKEQTTKVCIQCAGTVVDTPTGIRCLNCGKTRYQDVPDSQWHEWLNEIELAIYYAGEPLHEVPQAACKAAG